MHGSKETFSLQANAITDVSTVLQQRLSHSSKLKTFTLGGFGKHQDSGSGCLDPIDPNGVGSKDSLDRIDVHGARSFGKEGQYDFAILVGHVRTFTTVTPQPPSYGSPSRNSTTWR